MLRIGDGTEPVCEAVSPFAIRVLDRILAPREWSHAELARHIFPDLAVAATQSSQPNCPSELLDFWKERVVLTATHAIVDEVNTDMLLRDLLANDLPFGGKVLVLGGDFRQVLPVMPHCAR